jgi:thioredoxin 1
MAWGMLAFVVSVLLFGAGLQVWMAWKTQAVRGKAVTGVAGTTGQGVELLWFHSPGCGPCKVMEPSVRELAKSHAVRMVDVTRDPDAAAQLGVMATPTTVVLRGGVVERVQLGVVAPGALAAMLA